MKKIYLYLLLSSLFLGCRKATMFKQVPSAQSGIHFNNLITENDSINPIDNAYIYNGGGLGVGDFNNDGLADIYFTGNMVSNKLYLNKGDFKFEDVTIPAGVTGSGRWGRGVAVVDINNDGLADIYVCNSLSNEPSKRQNLLYVNQGLDKAGVPVFKEEAKAYGLDMQYHSTMASFFDYDNDGDLDMYLTVNRPEPSEYPNSFRPVSRDGSGRSTGKLYKNDWDGKLGHGVYKDVSDAAGVTIEGYGHGASIADINLDGWKDIYVTNDFLSSNILYINNHDGTFTDRSKEYFKHTSFNAMGQDIQDINNDGLADVFELDMNPPDNYRKKMMLMPSSYQTIQNFQHYGYQYQYVRNTLQLNQGPRINEQDSIGSPVFSEIGFMSGVAQTDWSWTPLIADFDNDSYKDIIVTNGYPRDVTDHDFMTYRSRPYLTATKKEIIKQIPEVKIHNYAFKNSKGLKFTDESSHWGLTAVSFSNGAVYSDLNNDGKLDLITNNINDEAFVYHNSSGEDKKNDAHFFNVKFKGSSQNLNGIGAFIHIYYGKGLTQVYENNPYRGYLSSLQPVAQFGLGSVSLIDSAVVVWPNGAKQLITKLKADQTVTVNIADARDMVPTQKAKIVKPIFTNITSASAINYLQKDSDRIDFNIQKLLPHKLSGYSPALAAGDLNSDGTDDIVIGGNSTQPAQLLLQQANGKFIQRPLVAAAQNSAFYQDGGVLLFDANGDNALDIYIARGGYTAAPNSGNYEDKLYINNGKALFTLQQNALPKNFTSKLCVRAFDYNQDGKLDLFVSGRVEPWRYPKPVSSFIFRNDSRGGVTKFTDVTAEVAPALKNIGLVCDAIFTDFDNDGNTDLLLAGEWMPLTFLKYQNGRYINTTATSGVAGIPGWWNSIVAGDFRHTGRIDYIVGNAGLNTFYHASTEQPVYITAKDFDKRDRFDAFTSLYLPGKDGTMQEYPANVRDDAFKQMISLRIKFTNYHSYAEATLKDLFSDEQFAGALRLKATELRSCYFRNDGNGKFTAIPLPEQAQISALNGMAADDFDSDGNIDLVVNGNDFGTDVSIGQSDALNGMFLKGNGKGGFRPLKITQSGMYLPGDGKALIKLQGKNNSYMLAASEHAGPLKLFALNTKLKLIKVSPQDKSAVITYKDGRITRQEFYYGDSFLSQSARFIAINNHVSKIAITDNKRNVRWIRF
ncbi:VCBS repeat-containing protein [Mucilaginibacter sp.]|uniref:VCBS repeat-containing protein n=1 Tax=Mucilaginibacter sp. TaxID=1882438 RepID=UPI0032671A78